MAKQLVPVTVTFTTSGVWQVPPWVSVIRIIDVCGGGGGGGGGDTSGGGAGAGGIAAASLHDFDLAVVPGETLTISIGAGGSGGAAGAPGVTGQSGGNTTIVGSVSGQILHAFYGLGGNPGSGASGGAGGSSGAGISASRVYTKSDGTAIYHKGGWATARIYTSNGSGGIGGGTPGNGSISYSDSKILISLVINGGTASGINGGGGAGGSNGIGYGGVGGNGGSPGGNAVGFGAGGGGGGGGANGGNGAPGFLRFSYFG